MFAAAKVRKNCNITNPYLYGFPKPLRQIDIYQCHFVSIYSLGTTLVGQVAKKNNRRI